MKTPAVVNVASVPHRSPFRYPGGKTWLVPHLRKWLAALPTRPRRLIEPFAGGAIIGLTAVFEDLVDEAVLVELDDEVAAVWQVILEGQAASLADRIVNFRVSLANVRETLDTPPRDLLDRAFTTIVRNRMQRGGIMSAGASLMKAGENGKGLLSRWYPETLQRRILELDARRERIRFVKGDGLEELTRIARSQTTVAFIDPPYTVAGRRLYSQSVVDHQRLFRIARSLHGDFLMTYDNAPAVRDMAEECGFDTEPVSMKNTHHAVMSELLIGRDLGWARRAAPTHQSQRSLLRQQRLFSAE
jgi:DNA adenine methylase